MLAMLLLRTTPQHVAGGWEYERFRQLSDIKQEHHELALRIIEREKQSELALTQKAARIAERKMHRALRRNERLTLDILQLEREMNQLYRERKEREAKAARMRRYQALMIILAEA